MSGWGLLSRTPRELQGGAGRFFCVLMLFGRLTQMETLVSDSSKASSGSTLRALRCPNVLAFT